MAGGNNHAKRIVIDEAESLAQELQNGHAGCAKTQGRAIALIVKMISPLYEAEFVTTEECRISHDKLIEDCHGKRGINKITKLKIGPIQVEGPIITTILMNSVPLICCGILAYMLGKTQHWW